MVSFPIHSEQHFDPIKHLVTNIRLAWGIVLEGLDGPHEGDVGNFEWGSHVDTAGTEHPTVYSFTDNEASYSRNSGAPELMTKLRTSFEPEPEWLYDARWYDWEGRFSDEMRISAREVKDDLWLRSTQW